MALTVSLKLYCDASNGESLLTLLDLSAPVDVYSEWVDAAGKLSKPELVYRSNAEQMPWQRRREPKEVVFQHQHRDPARDSLELKGMRMTMRMIADTRERPSSMTMNTD